MHLTADEVHRLAQQEIPKRVRERTVASLFVSFAAADAEIRAEHDPVEAHDLIGHTQRAKFETNFRAVTTFAGLNPTIVTAGANQSRHTEARTETFRLLAARVSAPGAMVHRAEFLETAAWNGQLTLDGEPQDDDRPFVFGLFAYSRSVWRSKDEQQKWGHLPGSLHLAFPDRTLTTYVHTIDLFKEHADVVRSYTPAEWDEPAFIRYIERARRRVA